MLLHILSLDGTEFIYLFFIFFYLNGKNDWVTHSFRALNYYYDFIILLLYLIIMPTHCPGTTCTLSTRKISKACETSKGEVTVSTRKECHCLLDIYQCLSLRSQWRCLKYVKYTSFRRWVLFFYIIFPPFFSLFSLHWFLDPSIGMAVVCFS